MHAEDELLLPVEQLHCFWQRLNVEVPAEELRWSFPPGFHDWLLQYLVLAACKHDAC